MRDSVRAAFVAFTTPFEGCVNHFYCDVKGLVTVAIGNLAEPMQVALTLPFVHPDGTFASRSEIAVEWLAVKNDPLSARLGHRYSANGTLLRLTPQGIDMVVSRKLSQMDAYLASRFGDDYEDWSACAQLATLSMSWACGPAFRFPALEQALRARDFDGAAANCHMNEAGNPGLRPRNLANAILYRNAARTDAFHLDPSMLDWVHDLSVAEAETQPELPDLAPDSEPEEGTIHVSVEGWPPGQAKG